MDKKVQWSLAGAVWVLALGALGLGWLFLQRVPVSQPASAGAPAEPGSKFIDPVTKAEVIIASDTPHVDYQGRDYYFSTARDERGRDHKTLFLMDPELYLSGVSSYKNLPVATPAAAAPATAVPLSPTHKAP